MLERSIRQTVSLPLCLARPTPGDGHFGVFVDDEEALEKIEMLKTLIREGLAAVCTQLSDREIQVDGLASCERNPTEMSPELAGAAARSLCRPGRSPQR